MDNLSLTPAERYVIGAIAALNSGAPLEPVPEGLWPDVRAELRAQTVEGLFAGRVGEMRLAPAEELEYLQDYAANLQNWHKVMLDQAEVLAVLQEAAIPVAVLKGAAAAMYYPNPEGRSMGDIDLIVQPCDFERALNLMSEAGWALRQEYEINPRHAEFKRPGHAIVELHHHLSIHPNKPEAKALDGAIRGNIPNARLEDVRGYAIPILPPVTNGLVLLAHLNQHLWGGLGYRQLIDWHMFVEAHLSDEFWKREFQLAAQQINLGQLAAAATVLCRKHFGLMRNITWCDYADDKTIDDLLVFVARQGNMGRKTESPEQATRKALLNFRSPASLVRYLYAGGKVHWAPARHHKWLAPAACVYQIGHIIRKGATKNIGAATVRDQKGQASQVTQLLENLGATRI